MNKLIYCGEVLGLAGVWHDLHNQDKNLHREFMRKVFELNSDYMDDVSDIFEPDDPCFMFLQDSPGYLVLGDKTYTFITSQAEYVMRCDERFHQIVEEYVSRLTRNKKILYKEISDERFPSMVIVSWDDGSEHIMFTD